MAIDPEKHSTYNLKNENMTKSGYVLQPGEFILAETVEKFDIPRNIAAKVDGRSSMGRMGITVHITAGFVDPGFKGTITLEVFNANNRAVILRPGMIVAQMCFFEIEPCERDYQDKGGRYQNERGATGSRYYQVVK
jgi:dCTP deaminase